MPRTGGQGFQCVCAASLPDVDCQSISFPSLPVRLPPINVRMHEYFAFVAKRYLVLVLTGLATIVLLGRSFWDFDFYIPIHPHLPPERSLLPEALPPLYSEYHRALRVLPQHHWEQEAPGPDDKFLYIAGHTHGM